MRISFFESAVTWFVQPLKNSDYKNTYISLIGSMVGGGLTVLSAIILQDNARKKEKEAQAKKEKENKESNIIKAKEMCKAILLNEIINNNTQVEQHLKFIIEKVHWHVTNGPKTLTVNKWQETKFYVLDLDPDGYKLIQKVYDYFELLFKSESNAKELSENKNVDFNNYNDDYSKLLKYLE